MGRTFLFDVGAGSDRRSFFDITVFCWSIERTRKLMQEAAKKLDFIEAAQYRDEFLKMEDMLKEKV